MLYGKGVWAWQEPEVNTAIQMARAINATHILFKTGAGARQARNLPTQFYADAATRTIQKITAAGLIPFAWVFIFSEDPAGEANVVLQTRNAGYAGIVLDIEDQSAGKQANIAALGVKIRALGIDPQMLYFTSFPNFSEHGQIPYAEMNAFCSGGFMPQSYATFRQPAEIVLGALTYDQPWPSAWGTKPPYYPILGLYYDNAGNQRMTADEFRIWARALSSCHPTFYSIFRAGVTNPDLFPLLRNLEPYGEIKSTAPTDADYQSAVARAWAISSYATHPEFAFPIKAAQALGANAVALGDEQRMYLNGYEWAWQLWTSGAQSAVLLTQAGHWDLSEIRVMTPLKKSRIEPRRRKGRKEKRGKQ